MLAVLLLVAGAAAPPPAPSPTPAPVSTGPNLLLVTIDTLRADRLGAYGNTTVETPVTDRLAREGVVVEDATVQVPQTRPSHASLLTGRNPYEHGIRDNYAPPLAPGFPTLATVLKGRGFDTGAFIGSYTLASSSGLNRGFAVYDEPFTGAQRGSTLYKRAERPGGEVVGAALRWLARPRSAPFFAWVHLYDPHAPYAPPAPYDRRYAGRAYDGEVAYADAQVGRLVDFLDKRGLRERTLVVVTSDHGEGLGDHDEDEHLMFLYDSTLHVPWIASWRGVLPLAKRVPGQFRSIDLLPTLLELLGVPAVPVSGVSRAVVLRAGGRIPDNESYAESLFGNIHFGYAPLRALRAEGWKYVEAPRPEVYNLREDPREARNLMDSRAGVGERMRARLIEFDTGPKTAPATLAPDAGTMERLAALGYVGGGSPRSGAPTGADPKDKIHEFQAYTRDMQKATRLFGDGDFDGALVLLSRLGKSEIVSFEVQHLLGKSLLRKQRFAEAAAALEEAMALVPQFGEAYVELARAYAGQGKITEARGVLERGRKLDPKSPVFDWETGTLLHRAGDLAGARSAFEAALRRNSGNVRLRLALSAVQRDQGDLAGAIAGVREAVRLDPAFGDGWNALGALLSAQGSPLEAAGAFERALRVNPDDADSLFGLAEARMTAGRAAEAVPPLERLLRRTPDYPGGDELLRRARATVGPLPAGTLHLALIRVGSRAEAEGALRRVAAGEDFAAVARALSRDGSAARGGDLGFVRLEDLEEPLRSAAAALAPAQSSPVVETPAGFLVLRRYR